MKPSSARPSSLVVGGGAGFPSSGLPVFAHPMLGSHEEKHTSFSMENGSGHIGAFSQARSERKQHPSPQASSTQAKMGNKFKLVNVVVNPGLHVTVLLRPVVNFVKMAPYFIVREIDHKMLRAGEVIELSGSSEQSKRAHIRSTVVKMNFDHDTASKEELQAIKKRDANILGVIFFSFALILDKVSSNLLL